ncbi:G-type lectin S-receptor-like serine/threonine-protein kinase SD2-5 [Euphorbia peplus]|nr:G-type lectin S-receptor-like serine/threonine-protein kinase SD2-5 [Euphorbia peplus]
MGLFRFKVLFFCLCLVVMFKIISCVSQYKGEISSGFEASHMDWKDQKGTFLLSENSTFGLGFYTAIDTQFFLLVVAHLKSAKVVWTANRGLLVSDSDRFVFEKSGNVYLQRGDGVAWSPDTGGKAVSSMELMESGNLMFRGKNGSVLWQSFSHPTDTLLPGQEFVDGMRLKSFPNKNSLNNYLEIKSGDLVLYAGYSTPQVYWSLANDTRKTNGSVHGKVHSLVLVSNSWNIYDKNRVLLWQFVVSESSNANATWAVILGSDGAIGFYDLHRGTSVVAEATKIPRNSCSVPEPCDRYYVCYFDNWCQCPNKELDSQYGCRPPVASTCNSSETSVELLRVGEQLSYFALGFVTPSLRSNLSACRDACLGNCSCIVLFFEESSGRCFLFDQIGSFTRGQDGSSSYISYMKVSTGNKSSGKGMNGAKEAVMIILIVIATIVAIAGVLYMGKRYYRKGKEFFEFPQQNLDDDDFLDSISGMPTRYTFSDLCKATKNFSMKIGHGGFGSVYLGVLPDGTRLAVKQLEGVGQGKKEFRAEVSIIGSVHHVHLVKLKGFCTEGSNRLLVYEYLVKGSLDKWIFKNDEESSLLDWDTRYNIAIGMAKGLAYLHEECEVKIVHCDIKPENVLLDDNFTAKVSDFGLAKLMSRDDSLVYTTVRGTRGYLAPEWITHNPISEKSDVYSYGIVLLEIIGGRKNYDSSESSEKSHFPSYSFKMLEEGRLREIVDPKLDMNENDEQFERFVIAVKVALWCIQEDMQMRPPMSRVVQMLEGLCDVPDPPISSQLTSRSISSYVKWKSGETSSSGIIDDTSDAFLSDIRLSGPR